MAQQPRAQFPHSDVVPEAGESRPHDQLSQRVYLTTREAATYLGLPSVEALQQRVRRGKIDPSTGIPPWCWTRMGSKSLRFLRAALDEWLQPKDRAAALGVIHGRTLRAVHRHEKAKPVTDKAVAR